MRARRTAATEITTSIAEITIKNGWLELVLEAVLGRPGTAVGVTGLGQFGADIVSTSVLTVPPNESARPVHVTVLPIAIPGASMIVPEKVEFAPSVEDWVGVHHISHTEAPPLKVTIEFGDVVSAPSILKI